MLAAAPWNPSTSNICSRSFIIQSALKKERVEEPEPSEQFWGFRIRKHYHKIDMIILDSWTPANQCLSTESHSPIDLEDLLFNGSSQTTSWPINRVTTRSQIEDGGFFMVGLGWFLYGFIDGGMNGQIKMIGWLVGGSINHWMVEFISATMYGRIEVGQEQSFGFIQWWIRFWG